LEIKFGAQERQFACTSATRCGRQATLNGRPAIGYDGAAQ
jgi:hypothetical protein